MKSASLLAAFLCTVSAVDASAEQSCSTLPIAFDTDTFGAIETADCSIAPLRDTLGDYWSFSATAGDLLEVTLRRGSVADPYLFVLDPSGRAIASDDDSLGAPDSRIIFTAAVTGTYRAIATTYSRAEGTYAVRVEHVDEPLAPRFFSASVFNTQVTMSWSPPPLQSPGVILEYLLEVGTAPGAADLGTFGVGTTTRLIASAPRGNYYVRVRARNANGVGQPSNEVLVRVLPPPSVGTPTVSVSGRRVTLRWFPSQVVHYSEVVVGSGEGLSNLGVINVGPLTTITVDDVPPGTYYVRVRATNERGTGDLSPTVVFIVF